MKGCIKFNQMSDEILQMSDEAKPKKFPRALTFHENLDWYTSNDFENPIIHTFPDIK